MLQNDDVMRQRMSENERGMWGEAELFFAVLWTGSSDRRLLEAVSAAYQRKDNALPMGGIE